MSTITEILISDNPAGSVADLNANFDNLNTDKVEGPASSQAGGIVLFDGLTGKLLKDTSYLTITKSVDDEITLKPIDDFTYALYIHNDSDYGIGLGNTSKGTYSGQIKMGGGYGGVGIIAGSASDIDLEAPIVNVGPTGSDGILQSRGNVDLILRTGNATTGSITVVDGADADVDIVTNGSGNFHVTSSTGRIRLTSDGLQRDFGAFGIYDSSGNELFLYTGVASAINEIEFRNAAAGTGPQIRASGGDTNIGLELIPKGSGNVYVSTGIELGHATANTLTASGGVLYIEGTALLKDGMAEKLIKGRAAGAGAGPVTDLTGAQVLAIIDHETTDSPEFAGINLGHASDTTITRSAAGVIAVEGVVIPSISSTNTFTNKRVTPRIGTTTSSATPTINTDDVDFYSITAQTEAITSFTTNLSGTPTDGQKLWIAITGTAARAITWGASFENGPVALPTTTVTTTRLDVAFIWNAVTSKWRCVASGSTV